MLLKFRFIDKCPKPKFDTGCTYCRPQLNLPIKYDNLNHTAPNLWKHVLILNHGYNSMSQVPSNIFKVPGLAQQLRNLGHSRLPEFPLLISYIFPTNFSETVPSDKNIVYLYPDNVRIEFPKTHLQQFNDTYLVPKNVVIPEVFNPFKVEKKPEFKTVEKDETIFKETKLSKPLYLVCGHTLRDERCGILAPKILDELHEVTGDSLLASVTHVGGHAYAGNVIILPEGIWYGRIMPENVQGMVESYESGHIIKDLYRGGFDM